MALVGISAGILVNDTDLTPLQIRSMFRRLGYEKQPASDHMMDRSECLKVWVFMLVQRLKILDNEQRDYLFDTLLPDLDRLATILEPGQPGVPILMLADGRYATWTYHEGWLDLLDGNLVEQPAQPAMETLGYNLAVLFDRNKRACAELIKRAQAKNNEPSDESEG